MIAEMIIRTTRWVLFWLYSFELRAEVFFDFDLEAICLLILQTEPRFYPQRAAGAT
jgi:hypothetical protein